MMEKAHKGCLVTLDDSLSKLRLAAPLKTKHAKGVTEAIIKLLDPIKEWVHTIAFDNGKGFAFHERITKKLDCNAYFAKPYHSWERGQNENANGLLRQYFPKLKFHRFSLHRRLLASHIDLICRTLRHW